MVNGKHTRIQIGNPKTKSIPRNRWYIHENAHEAIVTKEVFDTAAKCLRQIESRTESGSKPDTMSGKVRCGCCGYAMKWSGKVNKRYFCRGINLDPKSLCYNGSIKNSELEYIVLESIQALFKTLLDKEQIARKAKASSVDYLGKLQELQKQIDNLKRYKVTLYVSYNDGQLSKNDYLKKRNESDLLLSELEKETSELEVLYVSQQNEQDNSTLAFLKTFDLSAGLTYELVDALVEKVLVYDESTVEIVWKVGDDFRV